MAYRGSFPFAASAYHFGQGGAPGNALTRGRRQDRPETPAQRIARMREEERQRQMQSLNPAGMPGRQVAPDRGFAGPDLGQSPYGADRRLNPVQAAAFGNSDMGRIFQQARDGAPGGMPGGTPMGGQQPFVPTEPSFGQRFGGPLGDAGVAATRAATTSPTNPAPSFIQSLTEGLGQFTKSFTENERYLAEKGIQEEERFKADQFRDYQMDIGRAGEGRAVEEHELTMEAYEDKQAGQKRIRDVFTALEEGLPEGTRPSNAQRYTALQDALTEVIGTGNTGIAQVIADVMDLYAPGQDTDDYMHDIWFDKDGNAHQVKTHKQTLQTYELRGTKPDGSPNLVLVDPTALGWSDRPGTRTTGDDDKITTEEGLLLPAQGAERRLRGGDLDFQMVGATRKEGQESVVPYESGDAEIRLAQAVLRRAQEEGGPEDAERAMTALNTAIFDQNELRDTLPEGYLDLKDKLAQAEDTLTSAYAFNDPDIIRKAESDYYKAEEDFYTSQYDEVDPFAESWWKGAVAELLNQNQGQSASWLYRLGRSAITAVWVDDAPFQAAMSGYVEAMNFINPIVRFLSGAQMTNQEAMRYYQALVPVPGESIKLVLLKRRKRELLMDAMGERGDDRQQKALAKLEFSPGEGVSFNADIYGQATIGRVGNPAAQHMNRLLDSLNQVVGNTENSREVLAMRSANTGIPVLPMSAPAGGGPRGRGANYGNYDRSQGIPRY